MAVYRKAQSGLEKGMAARTMGWKEHELAILQELSLLTAKPLLYVANVDEEAFRTKSCSAAVEERSRQEKAECVVICGDLEAEIARLEREEERKEFMADMGLAESGLEQLVGAGYRMLNLITFYTTEGTELRAWTVAQGTRAPQAAGKIHSDMEHGFIKAEVVSYDDFVKAGSLSAAREDGHLRLEGKEYTVRDGDILHFKFNQ
jgi:hypothetical protein